MINGSQIHPPSGSCSKTQSFSRSKGFDSLQLSPHLLNPGSLEKVYLLGVSPGEKRIFLSLSSFFSSPFGKKLAHSLANIAFEADK